MERLTSSECLSHPYFAELRPGTSPQRVSRTHNQYARQSQASSNAPVPAHTEQAAPGNMMNDKHALKPEVGRPVNALEQYFAVNQSCVVVEFAVCCSLLRLFLPPQPPQSRTGQHKVTIAVTLFCPQRPVCRGLRNLQTLGALHLFPLITQKRHQVITVLSLRSMRLWSTMKAYQRFCPIAHQTKAGRSADSQKRLIARHHHQVSS